jgi:hypothetical protein
VAIRQSSLARHPALDLLRRLTDEIVQGIDLGRRSHPRLDEFDHRVERAWVLGSEGAHVGRWGEDAIARKSEGAGLDPTEREPGRASAQHERSCTSEIMVGCGRHKTGFHRVGVDVADDGLPITLALNSLGEEASTNERPVATTTPIEVARVRVLDPAHRG